MAKLLGVKRGGEGGYFLSLPPPIPSKWFWKRYLRLRKMLFGEEKRRSLSHPQLYGNIDVALLICCYSIFFRHAHKTRSASIFFDKSDSKILGFLQTPPFLHAFFFRLKMRSEKYRRCVCLFLFVFSQFLSMVFFDIFFVFSVFPHFYPKNKLFLVINKMCTIIFVKCKEVKRHFFLIFL